MVLGGSAVRRVPACVDGSGEVTMRIILDCDNKEDLTRCLALARQAERRADAGEWWGYWSPSDPDFSAVIKFNKASISVRGRRDPVQSASTHNGEAPITTAIEVGCGGKDQK
jgi:hypothetical protein